MHTTALPDSASLIALESQWWQLKNTVHRQLSKILGGHPTDYSDWEQRETKLRDEVIKIIQEKQALMFNKCSPLIRRNSLAKSVTLGFDQTEFDEDDRITFDITINDSPTRSFSARDAICALPDSIVNTENCHQFEGPASSEKIRRPDFTDDDFISDYDSDDGCTESEYEDDKCEDDIELPSEPKSQPLLQAKMRPMILENPEVKVQLELTHSEKKVLIETGTTTEPEVDHTTIGNFPNGLLEPLELTPMQRLSKTSSPAPIISNGRFLYSEYNVIAEIPRPQKEVRVFDCLTPGEASSNSPRPLASNLLAGFPKNGCYNNEGTMTVYTCKETASSAVATKSDYGDEDSDQFLDTALDATIDSLIDAMDSVEDTETQHSVGDNAVEDSRTIFGTPTTRLNCAETPLASSLKSRVASAIDDAKTALPCLIVTDLVRGIARVQEVLKGWSPIQSPARGGTSTTPIRAKDETPKGTGILTHSAKPHENSGIHSALSLQRTPLGRNSSAVESGGSSVRRSRWFRDMAFSVVPSSESFSLDHRKAFEPSSDKAPCIDSPLGRNNHFKNAGYDRTFHFVRESAQWRRETGNTFRRMGQYDVYQSVNRNLWVPPLPDYRMISNNVER